MRRGRATLASGRHPLQSVEIFDPNETSLHARQPALLEAREQPAHGLDREAQVVADVVAQHAEMEPPRGEAAVPEAGGDGPGAYRVEGGKFVSHV